MCRLTKPNMRGDIPPGTRVRDKRRAFLCDFFGMGEAERRLALRLRQDETRAARYRRS
jgi:hypothetical protein